VFNFEKLDVWQKTVEFVDIVYKTTKIFPKEELFGITSQLRRAAVSISLNIAEGAGRKSKNEFKHFISMAYGSLAEAVTLLKICMKREYLSEEIFNTLYSDCEQIGKMLSGLSQTLSL
jgi:four helix bundle protein